MVYFILLMFSVGWGCIDDVEVELWGECYNIEETTSLELSGSGLTGEIPPEIGDLTNLTYLNLYGNQLTGEIPPEIGQLTNLLYLFLYMNQLTGQVPSEIGNLVNLIILRLNDNNLSGEIPGYICDLTIDWSGVIEIHEIPLPFFDIDNNNLCPPYPDCGEGPITSEGYQDTSECECSDTLGDLNYDGIVNIIDIISLVNCTFDNDVCNECYDITGDGNTDVVDIIGLVNLILDI